MRRLVPAALAAAFTATLVACSGDAATGPSTPVISPPVIDSVAPAFGGAGATIRVHGSRFADSAAVYVGGVRAAGTLTGNALITAVVPGGLTNARHDVRVVNRDGGADTASQAFELVVVPVVDSIAPRTGTVGTEVRIFGTGFSTDSAAVFFGSTPASAVAFESGSLYAVVPAGIAAGTAYDVRVVNRGMAADTVAAAFTAVAPTLSRINGVTKPTGLSGMTIVLEGGAFGVARSGRVLFTPFGGAAIQAVVVDSTNDWTDNLVVTSVPAGIGDSAMVTIVTATGTSAPILFRLIQSGQFSPSTIQWTQATALPVALQGLGAVFVPIESGPARANYVFTAGGADSTGTARDLVFRATVAQTGALGASWATGLPALPGPRAYHATVAATAYTAAIDTAIGGYLYVIGGKDGSGTTVNSVHVARIELDGQLGAWSATTPLPARLHGTSAVVFRGYVYVAGGADTANVAQATVYRALVRGDGTLGAWEALTALPTARSHFSLVSFGPYLYAIGGETGSTAPGATTLTGTTTGNVDLARINLRTGAISSGGWTAVTAMGKARSKHSAIFAGGSILVSSGLYSGGTTGSSENSYASLNSDGTLGSWNGATGSETIGAELGHPLYTQAAITFIDNTGKGHVLVLGGAKVTAPGVPSNKVVFY